MTDPTTGLLEFQRLTSVYAHRRLREQRRERRSVPPRFLVADQVGLGKTSVARAVADMQDSRRSILYLASSASILSQNLPRLAGANGRTYLPRTSLSLLAFELAGSGRGQPEQRPSQGLLVGITPIRDLNPRHAGTARERTALLGLLSSRTPRLLEEQAVVEMFALSLRKKESRYALPEHARTWRDKRLFLELETEMSDHLFAWAEKTGLGSHATAAALVRHVATTGSKRQQKLLLGRLRDLLAMVALKRLNVALVIADEFQRFDDELEHPQSERADHLTRRPMLLLSATPYKPGRIQSRGDLTDHESFIRLMKFLSQDAAYVAELKQRLDAFKHEFAALPADLKRAQVAADRLAEHLRRYMVRTERTRDASIRPLPSDADLASSGRPNPTLVALQARDVEIVRQMLRLHDRAVERRNLRARRADLVELWKSIPYPLTFTTRYRAGAGFVDLSSRAKTWPAALTSKVRDEPVSWDGGHARLGAAARVLGTDLNERLWVRPSLPYVHPTDETPSSKTLVFAAWAEAPAAIATGFNLIADRRLGSQLEAATNRQPRGRRRKQSRSQLHQLLELSRPTPATALLVLPALNLADLDPLVMAVGAGAPLTVREMLDKTAARLGRTYSGPRSKTARRVTTARVLAEALQWPDPGNWPQSFRVRGTALRGLGQGPDARAYSLDAEWRRVMAQLALAGPGTCALRALHRVFEPDVVRDQGVALISAAARIGAAITTRLGHPSAVPVVNRHADAGSNAEYWQVALRYCLTHDLQSVLDEYVHLLHEELQKKDEPSRHVDLIAARFEDVLGLPATVARVRSKIGALGGGTFARGFGERQSEESSIEGRRRVTPVTTLHAFNSPFAPFVLTTTSVGQEGLDFHRYCRRLLHWNLPRNVQDLEQREGRVDRYKSLGVRTSLAEACDLRQLESHHDPWAQIVDTASAQVSQAGKEVGLEPLWHFGAPHIDVLPLNIAASRERQQWERLLAEREIYRLVLGQTNPQAMLDKVAIDPDRREVLRQVRLDLRPPDVTESTGTNSRR